VQNIGKRRQ